MKVTPTKKKFGKYAPGDEFDLPDKTAKVFVKLGKLAAVTAAAPTYQTRMMTAEAPSFRAPVLVPADPTPLTDELDSAGATWDEKVHASSRLKNGDGTWRKRPGARPSEAEPQL